jgi:phosphopantothenoylcysteine decarboxylase/phosphopantothenate--cysteine ligase
VPGAAFQGKRILLGVSGSIAAYKAVLLLRRLVQDGAEVTVVMTQSACRFVTPLTFETLSGRRVYTDLFAGGSDIHHLELAESADLILLAPATANLLSKLASGAADDLLSTLLLAARCPIVVAPAMDGGMWDNPAVRRNAAAVEALGAVIVPPESGPLASGRLGVGRLAAEEAILAAAAGRLARRGDLAGDTVLVTAGATREPIDPVRFVSNRSSGRMGYAVAEAARDRGAKVVLISGPVALPPPHGVERQVVETAAEMRAAVLRALPAATIVIMAAAVGDWRPAARAATKIKKSGTPLRLELEPTEDILVEVGRARGDRILVGFAAETERLVEHARRKLQAKRLDLIVANDVTQDGAGFETETNVVTVIDRRGGLESWPTLPKRAVAERLLDRIAAFRAAPPKVSK